MSECCLHAFEGSWIQHSQEYIPIDKVGKTSPTEMITSVDFTRQRMVRKRQRDKERERKKERENDE